MKIHNFVNLHRIFDCGLLVRTHFAREADSLSTRSLFIFICCGFPLVDKAFIINEKAFFAY